MKRIERERERSKESNKSTKSVGEEGQEKNDRISQHESKGDRIGLGSGIGGRIHSKRETKPRGLHTGLSHRR